MPASPYLRLVKKISHLHNLVFDHRRPRHSPPLSTSLHFLSSLQGCVAAPLLDRLASRCLSRFAELEVHKPPALQRFSHEHPLFRSFPTSMPSLHSYIGRRWIGQYADAAFRCSDSYNPTVRSISQRLTSSTCNLGEKSLGSRGNVRLGKKQYLLQCAEPGSSITIYEARRTLPRLQSPNDPFVPSPGSPGRQYPLAALHTRFPVPFETSAHAALVKELPASVHRLSSAPCIGRHGKQLPFQDPGPPLTT